MKINSILDLVPYHRSADKVKMDTLPKGKPDFRSVWALGPARIITYIFKGDVYKKISFFGKTRDADAHGLYKCRSAIIASNGDFLS